VFGEMGARSPMCSDEQTISDLLKTQEIVEQRAYEIGWKSELQSVHDAIRKAVTSLKIRAELMRYSSLRE
jgi:hypothetical protein